MRVDNVPGIRIFNNLETYGSTAFQLERSLRVKHIGRIVTVHRRLCGTQGPVWRGNLRVLSRLPVSGPGKARLEGREFIPLRSSKKNCTLVKKRPSSPPSVRSCNGRHR
jgi:hypothetical protein